MVQQQLRKQKRRKTADYEPAGTVPAAHLRESCRDSEVLEVLSRCRQALAEHDRS